MRTLISTVMLAAVVTCLGCGADEQAPPKAPGPPVPPSATAAASASQAPPVDTTPPTPPTPPKPTMAELQQAAVKAVSEALNAHDAKKLAAAYSADAVLHVTGMPEVKGPDAVAQDAQVMLTAFPDLKFAVARVFQKGDMALVEWVVNGTHSGDLMGFKATQKPVGYRGASLVWFDADGKVKVEHRAVDMGTVLGQVGAIKGGARAVPPLPAAIDWVVSKASADEEKAVESHKAIYAAIEAKKVDEFLARLTDDAAFSDLAQPKDIKGKKAAKEWLGAFNKAIPDLKFTVSTIFGAGEYSISEAATAGTWKGALGPMRPTNKAITLHAIDVFRFKDGKFIEGVTYANAKELLDAAGMWPKPPAPAVQTRHL